MLFWIIVTSSKGLIKLNISLFNCLIYWILKEMGGMKFIVSYVIMNRVMCYQGILRKIIFWIIAGYINIPVEEINGRQFVEKWFTASSGTVGKTGKESKGELPLVRLRLRYQTVHILPKDLYQDFTQVQTGPVVIRCIYIIKAFIHTYYNSARGIDIYGDVNYMYFANLQEKKKQLSKYYYSRVKQITKDNLNCFINFPVKTLWSCKRFIKKC